MKILLACLLLTAGCGSRTALDAFLQPPDETNGTQDAAPPCANTAPTPASACTRWEAGGPEHRASDEAKPGGMVYFTSVIADDCGLIGAWSTLSGRTLRYRTRRIEWDGALAAAEMHPALATQSEYFGWIFLAKNAGAMAALLWDIGGCRFVALDPRGADVGAPVPLGHADCTGFGAAEDGFSFLVPGWTATTLELLDAHGDALTDVELAIPIGRSLWDRLVFEDGSFLLTSFFEDVATKIYTSVLQHFDVHGEALAPEVIVPANTAQVAVAVTSTGAIAGWTGNGNSPPPYLPLQVEPIDRDGNPTGPTQTIATSGAPTYGPMLTSAADGGALLTWIELYDEYGEPLANTRVWAQALAPDATPRGPATLVLEHAQVHQLTVFADPRSARALVVLHDDHDGVVTLPLSCAP